MTRKLCTAAFFASILAVFFATPTRLRAQDLGSSQAQGEQGALPGASFNFQTDLFTGRFAQSIPIVVPPARQQSEPKIGLQYSSSSGGGWVGIGWSLDMGFIQRNTRAGVPVQWSGNLPASAYDDAKGFFFSFQGTSSTLVNLWANEYRAQVDRAFLRFDFVDPYWVVTDKQGTKFYFGETAQARLENPDYPAGQSKSVFRWAIERIQDTNGNQTFFDYEKHSQLYLIRIRYNGNANAPAIPATHTVEFVLEDRTDKTTNFISGFKIEEQKRLHSIVVKVGSQLVRRYELTYSLSPAGRSLLSQFQQIGADGLLATALPAMKFTYQGGALSFGALEDWPILSQGQTSAEWNTIRGTDASSDGISTLVDLDADGLPDRVQRKASSPYNEYLAQRNMGFGFGPVFSWKPLSSQGQSGVDWNSLGMTDNDATQLKLQDMDGDGYPDRVMRLIGSPYDWFAVQRNLGASFDPVLFYWGPLSTSGGQSGAIWNSPEARNTQAGPTSGTQSTIAALYDMNGDGLPDRVLRKNGSPYDRFQVQLNTGTGFGPLLDWKFSTSSYNGFSAADTNSLHKTPYDTSKDTTVAQLIDINGDGLPDRVFRESSGYDGFAVEFNNGHGFEPYTLWTPLDKSKGHTGADWGSPAFRADHDTVALLLDLDGDGLRDRVLRKASSPFDRLQMQRNTGSGFTSSLEDVTGLSSQSSAANWNSPVSADTGQETNVDLIDMDGDGLPDRVLRKISGPYNVLKVQRNLGKAPDLLVRVENGLGGWLDIAYQPSTKFDNRDKAWNTDPWVEGAKSLLPFVTQTVASVTVHDGMGKSAMTSYSYKGGMFDPASREFRGFHRAEVLEPLGTKTIRYFHQGGGLDDTALGEYFDDGSNAKKGIPFRIEVWDSSGKKFQQTLNKVEEVLIHPAGWTFPYVSQTIEMHYEGLAPVYRATAKRLEYDIWTGNLTRETKFGEVGLINETTHDFVDFGADKVVSDIAYFTFPQNPDIVSKPLRTTLSLDGTTATKLRESVFTYDTRGNMYSRSHWLNTDGSYASEIFQYDGYGNLVQHQDAVGTLTTTDYDAVYATFPTGVHTGIFSTSSSFDVRSGQVLTATNPAGLVSEFAYDNFFRNTETRISAVPYGSASVWKSRISYQLAASYQSGSQWHPGSWILTQENDGVDAVDGRESLLFYDGLGRNVQQRVEAENGQFRVVDTVYDPRGKPQFVSLPRFESSPMDTPLPASQPGTSTVFDAIGREALKDPPAGDATSPTGSQSIEYREPGNPWVTVTADAEGRTRKYVHDAYGNVSEIHEVTSQGTYVTTYEHDLAGNLTKIRDSAGNETRMYFDSLGRKYAMDDPDSGHSSYGFDALGRTKWQFDAKGQQTQFDYDAYGRLITARAYDASGGLEETISYSYDQSDDPNYTVYPGQLYKIVDGQGWQKNSYDVKGRVLKTTRYLNFTAKSYTMTSVYDDADHLVELRYPNGIARLAYSYDSGGRLQKIESISGTGPKEIFYQAKGYDEFGQLLGVDFGNGAKSGFQYFPNSKRLQRLWTTDSSGLLIQDLSYTYNRVHNITSVVDAVYSGAASATTVNIQYDELDRLQSFWRNGKSEAFAYSPLGNMLLNTESAGAGQYQYLAGKAHAVSYANGKSYGYDAAGNMITRGAQTLSYDAQNRLRLAQGGGAPVQFGYAHDGRRLWKQQSTSLSLWIGDHYEEKNGEPVCHVIAENRRICSFKPVGGIASRVDLPSAASSASSSSSGSGGTVLSGTTSSNSSPTQIGGQASFTYYHNDHLGTPNALTDGSGKLVQHFEQKAFGADRFVLNPSGVLPSHRFTDQIFDSETGLYYFKSRYYDADLGRFVQPDRLLPGLDNPQALNRYSYSLNNPLKYVDPSGHSFFAIFLFALFTGALAAVNAYVQGEDPWEAFKQGFVQGAIQATLAAIGVPSDYAKLAVAMGSAAVQGQDPIIAAVSTQFSAFSNSFNEDFVGLDLQKGQVPSFGTIAQAAGKELLYNTAAGGAMGAATAMMQGQDAWQGMKDGAVGAAKSSAFRIAMLGTTANLPYSQEELGKEFGEQSKLDGSGLDLKLPSQGSYHTTVGGLLKMIPGMRTTTFGTTVALAPDEVQQLGMIAHELRHVSQYQTLGAANFIQEYLSIVDDELVYSLTGEKGQLYNLPGSSDYGYRLEPMFCPTFGW